MKKSRNCTTEITAFHICLNCSQYACNLTGSHSLPPQPQIVNTLAISMETDKLDDSKQFCHVVDDSSLR